MRYLAATTPPAETGEPARTSPPGEPDAGAPPPREIEEVFAKTSNFTTAEGSERDEWIIEPYPSLSRIRVATTARICRRDWD
jgi:hypothetical protein